MTIDMESVDNFSTKLVEDVNNNTGTGLKEITKTNINNINGTSKLFSVAEITPNLMLCGASALRGNSLVDLGVSCVVTAAPELPALPLPSTVKEHHTVNIRDTSTSDISSYLHQIADTINQVATQGGRTLVHCVAGVSRSASLCLGYLIKYEGMSLREAFNHTQSRRPCIRPNSGFFTQLIQFEKQVTGQTSVKMVYNQAAGGVIPDIYEPDYYNTMRYNSRNIGAK